MPSSDWILFGLYFVLLMLLIGLAEVIRRLLSASPEITRKSVHILTGVLVATTPFVFDSKVPMAVLAIIFIIVNAVGIKADLFRGMHGTSRITYGTVFYPVSFLILLLLLWDFHRVIFVAAMLILAIADALAAIIGENLNRPHEFRLAAEKKSIEGSVVMMIATVLITYSCIAILGSADGISLSPFEILWIACIVAVVATICEAVSTRGSDNLSLPLGAAFVMHYMLTHSTADQIAFSLGVALAVFVATVSYRAKFLDAGGAAVTFVLATLVFGIGRWTFAVPILTFFVLSSLLSRLGRKKKDKFVAAMFEKTGTRDFAQVFANGGIAGILLVMWYFFPSQLWYTLYVASIAAVTADTWGTELGVLSRFAPRSIITFKKVPVGSSGGVTLAGSVGGLTGAAIVAGVSWLSYPAQSDGPWTVKLFFFIVASAVLASAFDSVLGATVQGQYRCPSCEKITEKKVHCDNVNTMLIKGAAWLNNDVVNTLCALCGIALAYGFLRM